MLLVCPKCVTQYEVDDQAIPENGREVQCANCEHIWFQDQIKMLSDRPVSENTTDASGDEAPDNSDGVFEDLTGVKDVQFHTARSNTNNATISLETPSAEIAENILNNNFDDEEEYDDDPSMDLPEGGLEVDDKVLEVLRNEAAFSSARAQLDAAAADNLDTFEPDEPSVQPEPDSDSGEDGIKDLDAFLDALADEAEADIDDDEPEDIHRPILEDSQPEPETQFDPLSDLDAIRRQLGELDEDNTEDQILEVSQEYQSLLPVEDGVNAEEPEAEQSAQEDDNIDAVIAALDSDRTEYEPEEFIVPDFDDLEPDELKLEIDDIEIEAHTPEVDEFEEYPARRAFRADGAGLNDDADESLEDDTSSDEEITPKEEKEDLTFFQMGDDDSVSDNNEPQEQPGSAIPAAALGVMRPRSSGGSARVRSVRGAEEILASKSREDEAVTAASTHSLSRPTRPVVEGRTARPRPEAEDVAVESEPKVSRKELLPDVEELNSTLRNEVSNSHVGTEMAGDDAQLAKKSFGRSFAITLLVLVLLVALYVMKPMIVAALPATAVMLDPYVGFIDSIRLSIEQLVAKVLG